MAQMHRQTREMREMYENRIAQHIGALRKLKIDLHNALEDSDFKRARMICEYIHAIDKNRRRIIEEMNTHVEMHKLFLNGAKK